MTSAIDTMLKKYKLSSDTQQKNALKEIMQEIALLGLFRSGFFSKAAFYGGSALRMFHGLDRFSEDLDFTLLEPDKNFELINYTSYIEEELGAYGFKVKITEKRKAENSTIKSAFIKGGTRINLLQIKSIVPAVTGVLPNEMLKIKLELDIDPPSRAEDEVKYHLLPVPFSVRLYNLPSLFAGKIHALLCRKWKNRVKGRDFYDYLWFLSNSINPHLKHLTSRMRQTGHLRNDEELSDQLLLKLLIDKFLETDFSQAKKDVVPFIKNPDILNLWSKDFFIKISEDASKKWSGTKV
jgi:predicted nucleotidyltransferase component of viral defense system